jgi:Sec-independent protein translocase protein TatA
VGFGMELLFVLMFGLLILGPKRQHAILGPLARTKAELESAARGLKSHLDTELNAARGESKINRSHESGD